MFEFRCIQNCQLLSKFWVLNGNQRRITTLMQHLNLCSQSRDSVEKFLQSPSFFLFLSVSQEMCESGKCRVDGGRPLQDLLMTAIVHNRSLQYLCSCIPHHFSPSICQPIWSKTKELHSRFPQCFQPQNTATTSQNDLETTQQHPKNHPEHQNSHPK